MIRFPAVLTAKLARARIARAFQSSEPGRLLEFADAAEVLHAGSEHPVSHDKIRSLLASPAPIVWIGGSEPLTHSGIAHLVRALARSGVYLFLETDGLLLRRRIHEFQPLPRVFLTVRPDAKRKSDCDLAMEGLRAARLSGFFTCVHSQVGESSPLADLQDLRATLLALDVDAWLITAQSRDASALRKAAEARALLLNLGWRWISACLQDLLLAQGQARAAREVRADEKPQGQSCQEGVNVA